MFQPATQDGVVPPIEDQNKYQPATYPDKRQGTGPIQVFQPWHDVGHFLIGGAKLIQGIGNIIANAPDAVQGFRMMYSETRTALGLLGEGLGKARQAMETLRKQGTPDAISEFIGFITSGAALDVVGGHVLGTLGFGSIDNAFKNPNLLRGSSPEKIAQLVEGDPSWEIGTLGRGAHAGQGLTIREVLPNGRYSGRMIQWHPGGGHHGPEPYWKVSSPEGGTVRCGAAIRSLIPIHLSCPDTVPLAYSSEAVWRESFMRI